MTEITKPFLPAVNQAAVSRNQEHWPSAVQMFLGAGYGGEKTRKLAEEKTGDPTEHAPRDYCHHLSQAWCQQIDAHESAYFLLPRGSFRDSALDRSAKDKTPKGGAQ